MLTLSLEKPGEAALKLQLSLTKGATFKVTVAWECEHAHVHDVDVHALEARNDGSGAKVAELTSILSTYNTKKMNAKGVLATNPDGSFATPSGGLAHSGDVRAQGAAETITIDGSRMPEGVNEIPIFVTIHSPAREPETFAEIEKATIAIVDEGGKELGSYVLSGEFKDFNVVQFGSLLHGEGGWEYAAVGRGFKGNFNDVLGYFS
ncbi:MAG TPA: TerD family protein [Casimicrobiaceae bacterium]